MSYDKYKWVTGETITAAKLNHMEEGIEAAHAKSGEAEIPVSVAALKNNGEVAVVATYEDGNTSETIITLDDNGYPTTVTKDGAVCSLSWGGFE